MTGAGGARATTMLALAVCLLCGSLITLLTPGFFSGTQVFVAIAAFITGGALLAYAFWLFRQRYKSRILELTDYLEKVNANSAGTVIHTTEDDFSHLQDELYKTVMALHQARDAALASKASYADNLANIAHQLKTPITAALISAQLLEASEPNEHAERIRKQLARLTALEEAVLLLSRIDAGTLTLQMATIDVFTVLSLAANNLDPLLKASGISIEVPDRGCAELTGDLEWTMEALMNLMKNCAEHSLKGGTVHCDYSSNPLYTELLIWDEGDGFAPEEIPRLFERFFRGSGAKGTGIGIGLSLSKAIIEMENGQLAARNRPEGGACFEVRIYCH